MFTLSLVPVIFSTSFISSFNNCTKQSVFLEWRCSLLIVSSFKLLLIDVFVLFTYLTSNQPWSHCIFIITITVTAPWVATTTISPITSRTNSFAYYSLLYTSIFSLDFLTRHSRLFVIPWRWLFFVLDIGVVAPLGFGNLILGLGRSLCIFLVTVLFLAPLPVGLLQVLLIFSEIFVFIWCYWYHSWVFLAHN